MSYEEGEVYYFITYPGSGLRYPNIKTLVFVGMDITQEGEKVWCFQSTDSFVRFGSIFKTHDGDRTAILATEKDIHEMRDFDGLCKVLSAAAARRKEEHRR